MTDTRVVQELERVRWEGEMAARMTDAERRLDAINGSIGTHAKAVNDLALTVGALAVRVGVYAAVGSGVAGTAVSLAVLFFH